MESHLMFENRDLASLQPGAAPSKSQLAPCRRARGP